LLFLAGIIICYYGNNLALEPLLTSFITRTGGFNIPILTVQTETIQFAFDDQVTNAVLTITDVQTGKSVVLNSEIIKKAPKPERITAESILKEFSRKLGHDWC